MLAVRNICFCLQLLAFLCGDHANASRFTLVQNGQSDAHSLSNQTTKSLDYRLPTSLYPTKYHLQLFVVLDPIPEFQRFTATGDVEINITCVENTNQIYLHAVNLTISHETVRVTGSDGTELTVTSLTYEIQNDFFKISLNSTLDKGETYVVRMHYVAPIPSYRLNGMYQDFYQDPETSETRYIATTLFAPYHARRLFPCFDEPSFRAEYTVEIGHHKKYHAMANEEIAFSYQVPDQSDYLVDAFKPTPNISSYITAMIVSDFTYVEAPENRFTDRDVRVYAAPHLTSLGAGEYAANITDAVMEFLENRFQVKYPLGKLFSIALPNFHFSAMENIGMVTYKEPVLLYLKNETTEEDRYIINSVTSHELSHQWFGNIVACKFWSWVWLKEGFSSFYNHYAMNHTNPELKPWEMFVPKVQAIAMSFDSTTATHPLENHPPTSAAVADIYTTIPYTKGASINRMTSTFLTEDVFENAVKNYIHKYQYSSAEQNDLFDSLQEALDRNPLISSYIPTSVREIMNSWALQSGFPIINVSRSDSSHITLTQTRYIEDGSANFSTTWWVPIMFQPRSRPDLPSTVPDIWIPQDQVSITVEITTGETVIVNPDGIGYYRVQYDDDLRTKIVHLLKKDHTQIPVGGRCKLIDDYFNFALAGYSKMEHALDLIKNVHNDMNPAVWFTLQSTIDELLKQLKMIKANQTVELLQDYVIGKINHVWSNLQHITGDNQESLFGSTGMLYELLIRWSCDLGSCVALSEDIFTESPYKWQVSKEMQFPLYCSALAQPNSTHVFDYILNEYSNPKTLFGRKQRLLKALTCTKDQDKIEWLINEALDEESPYFTTNESVELLQRIAKKSLGVELILERLLENSSLFFDRFDKFAENILLEMVQSTGKKISRQVINLGEQFEYLNPGRTDRILAFSTRSHLRRSMILNSLDSITKWLIENS